MIQSIESLEPRYLLSLPTVAAVDEPGALEVALKVSSTTVKQSQSFSAKVTVTNTGAQTLIAVSPTLNQDAGDLLATKFCTPTSATLAPGKSVIFNFALQELIVGTGTLTVDATAPFGTSAGSVTQTMTTLPKTVTAAAITDASGNAYLKVGSKTVPIQIVDQNTGNPISGLTVATASANHQNSLAALVIVDSQNRYPLQTAVLEGAGASATVGAAAPTATTINVASGVSTAMSAAVAAIQTTFLPAVNPSQPMGSVSDAVLSALKSVATSKLPLPTSFIGSAPPKTLASTKVNVSELTSTVSEALTNTTGGLILENTLLVVGLAAAPEIEIPALAATFVTDLTLTAYESDMAEETDAPDAEVRIESYGGIPFISITPLPPTGDAQITWTPPDPVADITIHPTDSSGQPITGGSYELISKDDLSNNIVGVLDSNGSAEIPVELGNYQVNVNVPGLAPTTQAVDVPSNGASADPSLTPNPIVSGTLTTALSQATGFLAPGTQYSVTPHFFDKDGNEVTPTDPIIYQVHNPVGATVATVDPNTGLVTMGPGFGAALVTAWCDGVTTTSTLVSTNGNGKYPAKPPSPFTISPTTLHFTALQGGANPTDQTFDVLSLSTSFTNFQFTDKIGWVTVTQESVSGFNVFDVSVDTTGLNPGTYSLPVTISDDNSSYKQTVTVTLTITPAPPATLSSGTYTGSWTYPVFGFGDDNAQLTFHLQQTGQSVTGSWNSVILDNSVDTTGDTNNDTFYTGNIRGNTITLTDTSGDVFTGTISGNTIVGTSDYLQATGSFNLTAQG
jgi:hypothetical protein